MRVIWEEEFLLKKREDLLTDRRTGTGAVSGVGNSCGRQTPTRLVSWVRESAKTRSHKKVSITVRMLVFSIRNVFER